MLPSCPGSRLHSDPVPELIPCPHCGKEVEIFTNELSMRCYFCGGLVTREKRPSCFDWCGYASECIAEIETRRKKA